jgi:alanyl-tRNA synthetase
VVLAAAIEGKATVVIAVNQEVIAKTGVDAPKLIKEKVAPLIKGGGGGQKTLATAGGTDISALHQVIEAVKTAL